MSRVRRASVPLLVTERRWHFTSGVYAFGERWFDDLWASIPDSYLIYSRNGFNQSAIDRIRKEREAIESAQTRQTA